MPPEARDLMNQSGSIGPALHACGARGLCGLERARGPFFPIALRLSALSWPSGQRERSECIRETGKSEIMLEDGKTNSHVRTRTSAAGA